MSHDLARLLDLSFCFKGAVLRSCFRLCGLSSPKGFAKAQNPQQPGAPRIIGYLLRLRVLGLGFSLQV